MSVYHLFLICLWIGFGADTFTSLSESSHIPNQMAHTGDTLNFPPCDESDIPYYTAYQTGSRITVDGKLDELAWQRAPRSSRFRDLITGDSTMYDTRVSVLWDQDFLYVGYWIEEPDLQATLTERDAPIYTNNDVELFIAGKNAYYEFEVNSYNTIYEVFFIWESEYESAGFNEMAAFDRTQPGVRTFKGVGYKNHPRGHRIGYWNWDFEGLQHAVYLSGTINDDSDQDQGWTVELAIPWSGMKALVMGSNYRLPPENQDVWRMDFSRFNQYKDTPPSDDSGGWAWSPHGVWDSHVPECFTFIHFSDTLVTYK